LKERKLQELAKVQLSFLVYTFRKTNE